VHADDLQHTNRRGPLNLFHHTSLFAGHTCTPVTLPARHYTPPYRLRHACMQQFRWYTSPRDSRGLAALTQSHTSPLAHVPQPKCGPKGGQRAISHAEKQYKSH
jgi:hypothetical protein